uniref:Uncharacterized protein n=1 Tax=Micrococcus phage Kurnik TaxID=3092208 RepID=A0AAU6R648_9CAUD
MGRHDLNSADYERIEAALRVYIDTAPPTARPEAIKSIERTLDKIERLNGTGEYTIQSGSGLPLWKHRKLWDRRFAKQQKDKSPS